MSQEWENALDTVEDLPLTAEIVDEGAGGLPVPAGTSMLQTRGAYSTAMKVAVPRELKMVQARLIQEAELLGEDAYYGWGQGKDRVEGPSQALAHSAARCWGNCAIEPGSVQDLPGEWIITMYFIDHETGFTLGRPFKQSKKSTVYGKHDAERKADIRFSIGTSKATRNVVLKALPKSMIDRAIRAAKQGVRQKLETFIKAKGIPAAFDICARELAKHGIDEQMILDRLEIADVAAVDVDRLVLLRGDISAIQQGEVRASDVYKGAAGNGETPRGEVDPSGLPEAPKAAAKPEREADEEPATGNAPPWTTIGKPELQKLRKRLKALGLTDADLLAGMGKDDLGSLENLPAEDYDKADAVLLKQEKKGANGDLFSGKK